MTGLTTSPLAGFVSLPQSEERKISQIKLLLIYICVSDLCVIYFNKCKLE